MKYDHENDKYIFSTGKEIEPNCNYIGINEEMNVSEGYDGAIYLPEDDDEFCVIDNKLTKDECVELAYYMIGQWQKFKVKYS
jgi:hypothetical protein